MNEPEQDTVKAYWEWLRENDVCVTNYATDEEFMEDVYNLVVESLGPRPITFEDFKKTYS